MTSIFLLAKAFVRQNRWLLLVFVLWPLLLGALASPQMASDSPEDNVEIVQQEVLYGVAVTAFFASSAIYNERRSRRIIGILSKAVGRAEYLSGMLLGVLFFAATYFVAVNLSWFWMRGWHLSSPVSSVAAILFLRGMIASTWISSLALLFSTFLHPIFAALLAGGAAFAPLMLSRHILLIAPMTEVIRHINLFYGSMSPLFSAIAIAESALFLILAAQVFAKRDLNISVE